MHLDNSSVWRLETSFFSLTWLSSGWHLGSFTPQLVPGFWNIEWPLWLRFQRSRLGPVFSPAWMRQDRSRMLPRYFSNPILACTFFRPSPLVSWSFFSSQHAEGSWHLPVYLPSGALSGGFLDDDFLWACWFELPVPLMDLLPPTFDQPNALGIECSQCVLPRRILPCLYTVNMQYRSF